MSTGRRLAALVAAVVLALALYVSTFVISYGDLLRTEDPLVRNDVARLRPTRVERVETVRGVDQLRAILREARQRRLKVSISGSRPSQGGHTYTAGGFVLDMRGFNQVRGVDPSALNLTVEKVMQSSNIFTVGGTLSANAHGRDIDVTQVVEVVESNAVYHVLQAVALVLLYRGFRGVPTSSGREAPAPAIDSEARPRTRGARPGGPRRLPSASPLPPGS